ncbi:MAG TPA: flagellar biosynthesis anti-sigma factor FlgM, partial [Steroidobacteraceae bacterium]|nr:flagellar biosynthesis anti-sigma factor FlgM [Steroidobacteraceae bacterium]
MSTTKNNTTTATCATAWKVLVLGGACCLQVVQSNAQPSNNDASTVLRVDARHPGTDVGGIFQTIEAALLAASQLRHERPAARIRIEIATGTYYIDAPLKIGPELSGTAAAPTEIVGASATVPPRLLAGHRLSLHWQPYRNGIVQAK